MSDILLQTLSNTDIDWLVTTGERQSLAAEDILVMPDEQLSHSSNNALPNNALSNHSLSMLYLVQEGALVMSTH